MIIKLMKRPKPGTQLKDSPEYLDQYLELSAWWKEHGWDPVPVNALPGLGVIVGYEDENIAAGFLYQDNSCPVAMLEWVVTNPDNTARESYQALKILIDFIKVEAKATGYQHIMTTCKVDGLIKMYEKSGFDRTDGGMTHLILNLTD